jgi:hypothetical protein
MKETKTKPELSFPFLLLFACYELYTNTSKCKISIDNLISWKIFSKFDLTEKAVKINWFLYHQPCYYSNWQTSIQHSTFYSWDLRKIPILTHSNYHFHYNFFWSLNLYAVSVVRGRLILILDMQIDSRLFDYY